MEWSGFKGPTRMALAIKVPIRLLLLIPHLGGGGAERVTSLLARHLDPQRFEVHVGLITADAAGAPKLPDIVVVHRLGVVRVRYAALKLLSLIWAERPDLVLGSMAHLNFLLLLLHPFFPRKTRLLIRQNTTASAAVNRMTGFLYRWLYPMATGIVCQSEAMAADLNKVFAIPNRKLVVLANPVQFPTGRAQQPRLIDSGGPFLLCVARLSPEKGVDLLLRALQIVQPDFPDIQLAILGTGSDETSLKHLTGELGMQSKVTFHGYVAPAPFYANSTLFVCPSRYEGMPNALLEAGAAGLPIVATPSSEGVTGLLRGATGTWIAADVSEDALAKTLVEALQDLQALQPGQRRFRHAFLTAFDVPHAIQAYESVLLRVEATGHL
jgi:glycosyltransferase involved in cell wall biosynthesis